MMTLTPATKRLLFISKLNLKLLYSTICYFCLVIVFFFFFFFFFLQSLDSYMGGITNTIILRKVMNSSLLSKQRVNSRTDWYFNTSGATSLEEGKPWIKTIKNWLLLVQSCWLWRGGMDTHSTYSAYYNEMVIHLST